MDTQKKNPSNEGENSQNMRAEGNAHDQDREAPNQEQHEAPIEENAVIEEQENIQAPNPIAPTYPILTLEEAEKRIKRRKKAERSTEAPMIKRARHGVHAFNKTIIDDPVEEEVEEEEENGDNQWDHDEKWSDDETDMGSNSPYKGEVPSD